MSKESAIRFLKELRTNEKAKDLLQGLGKPASIEDKIKACAKIAHDLGEDVSFEDLAEALKEIEAGICQKAEAASAQMVKLEDDDVENVAGSWDMAKVTKTQSDFNISVGYQRDGSDVFYDAYWDRITYRAGVWYKSWYVENVSEIGGSIGAGFPLGRKGTMLDFAIQGGVRLTDDDRNWSESYIGIRLGLLGVGSWGKTRGQ